MKKYHLPDHKVSNDQLRWTPLCCICYQPVRIENSNTDEHGLAVHENCYLLKLKMQRAIADPLGTPHQLAREYSVVRLHSLAFGGER